MGILDNPKLGVYFYIWIPQDSQLLTTLKLLFQGRRATMQLTSWYQFQRFYLKPLRHSGGGEEIWYKNVGGCWSQFLEVTKWLCSLLGCVALSSLKWPTVGAGKKFYHYLEK